MYFFVRSAASFLFLALIVYCPGAMPQTLTVYSGNGQIVQENFRTNVPLIVRALDGAGQPMAGVPITWQVHSDRNWVIGGTIGAETVTDAAGLARTHFVAANIDDFLSIVSGEVRASSPIGMAVFKITTAIFTTDNNQYAAPPLVELLKPGLLSAPFEGPPGTVFRDAVVARVTVESGLQTGEPVPNVGVEIVSADDLTGSGPGIVSGPGWNGADRSQRDSEL